ncbi:hypothetical protein MTR_4g130650 [Medicago truncatula]|uniref:Uncharacterized protein n=1 Tax=Medicago truncatula TaxID=3880 RepID=G7JFL1_MEDTR|nr:hypothetical protein MTR_4g130650 [Medicago truncatula]
MAAVVTAGGAMVCVTRDARIVLNLMILENVITLLTELLTKLTRDNNKLDLLETMFNGLQRREAKGRIFEKGIFVLSRLYVRSDAPRQLISDVAVINWDEGRNFK